jgi:aspartyl-tRNA(Asn)/glutamyl-tRNA(Gln) amidotransferase subunit A
MVTRREMLLGATAGVAAARVAFALEKPDELTGMSLREASAALHEASISSVDLTRASLERIARLDKSLNSFITVTAESALAAARRADQELARRQSRGPLHGIPIALEDNIDTKGVLTSAASAVFADRVPGEDADVVRRLKDGGAVLLGKLNMHEFALGTTSAISHYGPVRNPWDLARSAGGSSGGCGAAVAAHLCYGAVGTDTRGSIRIPAAACGVVGLKPTFGSINTAGVVPVSTSFDHLGPMCRRVFDVSMMLGVMMDRRVGASDPYLRKIRVGVVRTDASICDAPVQSEVQQVFDEAVRVLRGMVASVTDVEISTPDVGGIIDAEMYQYHADSLTTAAGKYDPRTLAIIRAGAKFSHEDLENMRGELQRYRAETDSVFREVDVLVLPTLPSLPIELSDAKDPFAQTACTFPFSVGGWPAISVPCGFSKSGLPIGMSIVGPAKSEARILEVAYSYEGVTAWYRRSPVLLGA